jgi:O-glycosyl hydrolase
VLAWLEHISHLVRENDPHHLLTAGWWGDPTITAPYVDILSFHHWTDATQLKARIEQYRQQSDKPLILQEVGYHSWDSSRGEQNQARTLEQVIKTADKQESLAGWIIWTAFDFVPAAGQPANEEHFFGLWRTDLTPKPALKALPLQP